MIGNWETSEHVGIELLILGVLTVVYPTFPLDNAAIFIYSEGGGLYSNQLISKRLDELRVTHKKFSVEAYEAFTPRNLFREELFWTQELPLGNVGIPCRNFIDIDEFAMERRRLNRTKL